ncbi:glutamate receptor ionotropic, kainate 2-like isoform X3 [Mizuhopecten yessoensis]|uniref:glutamate receptor ionotropic, kainate 2-like isoform X3 n=1 Tax=Mizuhopecten yessoensis TaxID=6573 RepID=UPI000B458D27|nr:glutamate receptor ionotropic, kainate 2-like isoform X3 [Mizuhopecten yessoensis]
MVAKIFWLGTLLLLHVTTSNSLQNTIRIGGLFENEHTGPKLALMHAIDEINLMNDILSHTLLVYEMQDVKPHDSFEANKKVCREVKTGIAAMFGPVSTISAGHVQSICNSLSIPHIQAHWDSRDNREYYSISLYPDYLSLSKAFKALIEYWGWTSFTVLYEDNDGLVRLQEVLKATKGTDMKVTVRKLDPLVENYVHMFKDLISNPMQGDNRIIVDCDVSRVADILHQAQKVNMCSETFHYLFTSLDVGLVDLEDYKYGGANITAMRIVDPSRPKVMSVTEDWIFEEINSRPSPLQGQRQIPTDTALMYDAAHLFARALHELLKFQSVKTVSLSCSKPQPWNDGISLLNYMKAMDFEGLTGRIHYQNGRKRTDFELDIVELTMNGLQKVGVWNPRDGVNITKSYKERQTEVLQELSNKTLRVVTVLDKPYVLEIEPDDRRINGPRYEGFCIDLLDRIAEKLNFNYTVTPTKSYGGCKDGFKKCDGMVKELVERRADLAVAGMTITWDREQVIDFTKPFLNLGITILYKKPEPEPPKLFSFLDPLSIDVWVYMCAGYLCVSFMLFVIARFTPYEWCNPHPCNPDTDVVENQFSILNSLWFTIGSLMQQGCEIAPCAISTRLVAGIWWFFTLIMISSYTANLAAFLTVERMVSDISSVEDLAKQTKIKYGTLNGGSTKNFFASSKFPIYQRMWNFMKSAEPSVFVNKSQNGIARVKQGQYAFFAESTKVEYEIERECSLMQVGGWLDSKGYGIALPRDSPYRDPISNAILKLQEDQEIHKMYNTWWKEKYGGGKCQTVEAKKTSALGVKHVGGVFVVLIGGMVAGVFVAICEFIYKARKNAREDKRNNRLSQSLCSEMAEEFRFAIRCLGSSKKTIKRKPPDHEIVDNGLQFMPLTGGNNYGQNNIGGREIETPIF